MKSKHSPYCNYNVRNMFKIMTELRVDWNDVIKKEARGFDGADLGEVQGRTGISCYQNRFSR
ncbi:MAG: hypothetical protein ABJB85_06900 [Nitrososphaerota archaeon]